MRNLIVSLLISLFVAGCASNRNSSYSPTVAEGGGIGGAKKKENLKMEQENKPEDWDTFVARLKRESGKKDDDETKRREALEAEETKRRNVDYYKNLLFIVSPKSVYYANKSLSSKLSRLKLINTIKDGLDARFQREELTIIDYYERKMDLLEATACIDGSPEKCKIVRQNAMRNLDSLNKSQ